MELFNFARWLKRLAVLVVEREGEGGWFKASSAPTFYPAFASPPASGKCAL